MQETIESTSGMDFTPLFTSLNRYSFYIEDSSFFDKTQNLKTVEFVTIEELGEKSGIYFIEARKSIPQDRDEYYEEMYYKFYHSINLLLSNLLEIGRFAKHDVLEGDFKNHFRDKKIVFILIIPAIPKKHALKATDDLRREFNRVNPILSSIWDVKILVFNEEMSRSYQFIA